MPEQSGHRRCRRRPSSYIKPDFDERVNSYIKCRVFFSVLANVIVDNIVSGCVQIWWRFCVVVRPIKFIQFRIYQTINYEMDSINLCILFIAYDTNRVPFQTRYTYTNITIKSKTHYRSTWPQFNSCRVFDYLVFFFSIPPSITHLCKL